MEHVDVLRPPHYQRNARRRRRNGSMKVTRENGRNRGRGGGGGEKEKIGNGYSLSSGFYRGRS